MEHKGEIIQVTVDYQLDEYKQVLRDFIPEYYRIKGKKPNPLFPWNWPVVMDIMFGLLVPLVFAMKKRKVGDCVFTISETGISRASKLGIGNRAWSEVKAVHQLSSAYLVELKEGGAMPIPHRVFSPKQRQVFDVVFQRALKQTG